MSDHNWPETGKHPALGTILLHMDGDLDDSACASITQHFGDCWECRALRDKVGHGIHTFMEYRHDVLLPSVPPGSPQRHVFRLQSRELLAGIHGNSSLELVRRMARSLTRPRVATGITAAVSATVLVFLMSIPVAHPPALTAAELIQRARASASNGLAGRSGALPIAKKVVFQKIQLRTGSRTIEREVIMGGIGAGADTAPPDADWARLLTATPIDWWDPLGVDRYAHWSEHEGKGQDTVSEANGFATLNTVPAVQTSIESASLTVRETDWHPVAKRVTYADRAVLEVREIDYGVRDLPEPETVASSAKPPVRITEVPATPTPDSPSAAGLDEAEIRLREVLHKIGADLNEAPEIVRDGSVIRLRASTETAARKQELLASVQGIPYVAAEVSDPGTPSSAYAPASPQPATGSPTYSTAPPLIKPLQDFLGGLDIANIYLHGVRDAYRETLMGSSALQRLADRYSDAEWEQLQPELRVRVDRLAADYVDSVQRHSNIYLKQVSLALDEMLNRSKVSADPGRESAAPCRSWRAGSASVMEDLRQLETAFQRLFIIERTDQPISLSAETLLLESANLRARYSSDVERFCRLEPPK